MQYRYGERPKHDITAMTDVDSRPRCKVCGRPMARSGMKQGSQQWRCRKNGVICSTFLAMKDSPLPGSIVLAEMAKTKTVEQIAEACNSTIRATSARLREYGIKAQKPAVVKKPWVTQLDRLYPSREAIVEYIAATEIGDAMIAHSVQEQMCIRWEHHYGQRFMRLCKKCCRARPYDDMAMRMNGTIQRICSDCYVPGPNAGKSMKDKTGHAARLLTEYDMGFGMEYARQPWSDAQGINNYRFSMMGEANG